MVAEWKIPKDMQKAISICDLCDHESDEQLVGRRHHGISGLQCPCLLAIFGEHTFRVKIDAAIPAFVAFRPYKERPVIPVTKSVSFVVLMSRSRAATGYSVRSYSHNSREDIEPEYERSLFDPMS